ncbi:DUF4232 domain-containing protein [Streptomyces lunalinharesii]
MTMRTRLIAAALSVPVAMLALSACGGGEGSSGSTQEKPPGRATQAAPTKAGVPVNDDRGAGQTPVAKGDTCNPSDFSLEITASPKADDGGQSRLVLAVKNTTDHTCAVSGVPTVELHGPDDAKYGPVYEVPSGPKTSATGKVVRIPAGQSAGVELTYLKDENAGAWMPTEISLALPGAKNEPLKAAWPSADSGITAGAVQRQDAATYPGTFSGTFSPLF